MSELSVVPTAGWSENWAQPSRPTTVRSDWDTFDGRAMTWDDQGERDPRVSNLGAALWKLAALGLSGGVLLAVVTLCWLLFG